MGHVKFVPSGTMTAAQNSAKAEEKIVILLSELRAKDALRLSLFILECVEKNGIDYSEFMGAKAVKRGVKKAINALVGLF